MGKFDAAGFLQANNLQFVDVGDKPGQVKVLNPAGEEHTLDLDRMLASKGIKGAEIVYNTPDNPVERSPVGLMDRLKLSMGNAKGQLAYLKNNYQDAQLRENGDLIVKDKGAWYTVDPRGLGDGTGWDIAKELVGDVLDLGKDAVTTAGQVAGSAVGVAGGAPGMVAGAAAGGGLASGATIALGRILGTYDATPQEMARDVALDTLLSAGGEAVALGAKAAIVPAAKKALAGLNKAAPEVKSMVTSLYATSTGASESNIARLIERPEPVNAELDSLIKGAGAKADSQNLLRLSREKAIKAAEPLLQDAQKSLSAEWRSRVGDIVRTTPDELQIDAAQPIQKAMQSVGELGLLKPVYGQEGKLLRYNPVSPKEMAKKLAAAGVDEASAVPMSKQLANWANSANNVLSGATELKGKTGMAKLMKIQQAFDDFYYNIVDGREGLQKIITPISKELRNGLRQAAGGEASAKMMSLDSFYAANKPHVEAAQKALKDTASKEAFINRLYSSPDQNLAGRQTIEALTRLKGPEGQVHYDRLMDTVAAHDFIRTLPKGALGGSIPRSAAAAAAVTFGGPLGVALGASASPRLAAKSIGAGVKSMAAFSNMLKGLSAMDRQAFLQSPNLFGAALGEVMRASVPQQQP